jgi:formate C-acetyltransferase/4-hydroxyphenylacetate decarboxylase large subunit
MGKTKNRVSKNQDRIIKEHLTPTWPQTDAKESAFTEFEIKKEPSTKRTKTLKENFLQSQVLIDTEFTTLYTEGWKRFDGQPFLIRKARALKHALTCITPVINEDELLVMQKTRFMRGAIPYTSYSQKFFQHLIEGSDKEQGDESTLGQGGGFSAQDSKEIEQVGIFGIHREEIPKLLEDCNYWNGRCIEDVSNEFLKENYPEHDFLQKCFDAFIFPPSVVSIMEGRWIPAYDMVVEKGLLGLIQDCRDKISSSKLQGFNTAEKVIFWRSIVIALEGALIWIKNYEQLARKLSKSHPDKKRRKELREIADILLRVPANPSENFREALQAAWITHLLIQIECPVVGLSPGRWGQLLYPYYQKDIQSKKISRDEVLELLEVMRFKFECVEFVSPRSWSALSSMNLFQHLIVGGLTGDGKAADNELEILMLEAGQTYKTCQPTMGILVDPKTSQKLLLKAVECTKTGTGYPAWFNNQSAIQHLLYTHGEENVSLKDARDCGMGGCVEVQMQGSCHGICHPAFINQLKIFECLLNEGVDPRTKIKLFEIPDEFKTFDDIWDIWSALQKKVIHCYQDYWSYVMACHRHGQSLIYGSAFLHDCIEKGRDLDHNGARYNKTTTILCSGNVNVANSLASLKKYVFEEKKYSLNDIRQGLNNNFGYKRIDREGKFSFLQQERENNKWEDMHNSFLDAPKYGNDDDYVDDIFLRVWEIYNESVTSQKSYLGHDWVSAALSISSHGPFGRVTGATPDGRLAGVTLADAIQSPFPGTDVSGPLAMLRSAAKLDSIKMRSVQLNMKIHPTAIKDIDGSLKLISLIKNYFNLGGYHIQFNIVDSKLLQHAQSNPDIYRDLIVRVAGFSAYWVELSKAIQDEIIVRTQYDQTRI